MRYILAFCLIITATPLAHSQTFPVSESAVNSAFAGRKGALVVIDCSSGAISNFHPDAAAEPLAPCSTFKIWNTLIGLELGVIASAAEPFYQWDGRTRAITAWNKDLMLKEAFQASCVPAFQNLARQIGPERMQHWIDKIGYGDRDISAGIDVFWLPAKGRKTVLISPMEQAQLMCKLVSGKLPFHEKSLAVIKEIMTTQKTDRGVLYGKTGSGADDRGTYILGWFAGYVESNGRTYAFACAVQGEKIMGKDARAIVETVFEKQGLL
ncbi:MAG: class D beta-lactamase [Desulfobacteraceae bacterium]|nr:MAG: class D beta-lactamase [Desulfobacteraceae bacterium]